MNLVSRRLARPAAVPMARQLALGRAGFATAFLAAPVPALRSLGVDTATAQRISWLTRMMAVRDGALAAGALLAQRRGGDPRPWLVAGAVSDAVDAVAVAGALKAGRLKGVAPTAVVPGAAVAAALGLVSAARWRRS
jgi:hypothetical protein